MTNQIPRAIKKNQSHSHEHTEHILMETIQPRLHSHKASRGEEKPPRRKATTSAHIHTHMKNTANPDWPSGQNTYASARGGTIYACIHSPRARGSNSIIALPIHLQISLSRSLHSEFQVLPAAPGGITYASSCGEMRDPAREPKFVAVACRDLR